MNLSNQSCGSSVEDLRRYQHHVYAVFYSVILAPGLLGNVLALWVFQAYVRETKRGVVFMMNLAVADLLQVGAVITCSTLGCPGIYYYLFYQYLPVFSPLQVLSLPLRIYYYLNHTWPFGRPLCMLCFYLKYVNMYASIFFLVCVSVRRCELTIHPLRYRSNRRRGDGCVCAAGWLLVCLGCLPFPLLRNASSDPTTPNPYTLTPDLYTHTAPYDLTPNSHASSPSSYSPASTSSPTPGPTSIPAAVCFAELPMREVTPAAGWALMMAAELVGFILPLVVVLTCACLSAGSLRGHRGGEEGAGVGVKDQGEKRRALRMVLSCAGVFLLCFSPYHVTMPLDFLAKADALGSCGVREMVLRCHPVTLCLASLNSGLDPLMYYFTTDEFRRRLSRPEIPETFSLAPRLSCTSGGGALNPDL